MNKVWEIIKKVCSVIWSELSIFAKWVKSLFIDPLAVVIWILVCLLALELGLTNYPGLAIATGLVFALMSKFKK